MMPNAAPINGIMDEIVAIQGKIKIKLNKTPKEL
jgi:hypothetical protein